MTRSATSPGTPVWEFSAIGGYQRCDNHGGVERMLAATARLGAARVRVTTPRLGTARDYRDLFEETREHFRWVAGRAKEYGVTAMVELHPRTMVSSALRLLEGIDPGQVSVIHDAGNHVYEGGEDTTANFQMLADRLTHVHIKNARWVATPGDETGTLADTLHWAPEPTTLRLGQADVVAYFRALRSVGYDGWITVEDFSTDLPLEERTADNLRYLKAAAEKAADE